MQSTSDPQPDRCWKPGQALLIDSPEFENTPLHITAVQYLERGTPSEQRCVLLGTATGHLAGLHHLRHSGSGAWHVAFLTPLHKGAVLDVAVNGTAIATGGVDGTCVWTSWTALAMRGTEPERAVRRLSGHALPVMSLDLSPDGSRLLSLGADGHVRLTSRADETAQDFHCGLRMCRAICFTSDGTSALVGAEGGVAQLDLSAALRPADEGACSLTPGHTSPVLRRRDALGPQSDTEDFFVGGFEVATGLAPVMVRAALALKSAPQSLDAGVACWDREECVGSADPVIEKCIAKEEVQTGGAPRRVKLLGRKWANHPVASRSSRSAPLSDRRVAVRGKSQQHGRTVGSSTSVRELFGGVRRTETEMKTLLELEKQFALQRCNALMRAIKAQTEAMGSRSE